MNSYSVNCHELHGYNYNNNNIYTGGVLTLSGFRNGPVDFFSFFFFIPEIVLSFLCELVHRIML